MPRIQTVKKVVWSVFLISLGASFAISFIQVAGSAMILASLIFLFCLLVFLTAMIGLMIIYRSVFRTWLGWATPIFLLLIGNFPTNIPIISTMQTLLVIASIVAMLVATGIMLYYRDRGLKIFAGISLAYIWGLVLVWQSQGNLLDLWIRSLADPAAPSTLWFLNTLWCVTACVGPLAIIGFLGHTFLLLWQELRDDIPNTF